ncbi:MAG TPA: metal-dependent transcriptional regulator [Planctomycetaceae bacterium]|nr:metal-dependent transcriptional regulator [Planctomycetaceae bacterium]
MASLTVENYLKAALQIAMRDEVEWISTGQLATALQVSPGTVTSMLKTLADSGLAEYRPYEGARLTREGQSLALRMLRRHRLLELFLVKTLDLSWDQVHEEAENMEHAVSDMLIDRIDEFLGHPAADPHGDPIPAANGEMRTDGSECVPLSSVEPGAEICVARVTNQDPEFLRFLADSGLTIGAAGRVAQNSAEAGIVSTEFAGRPIALGHPAARQVLVRVGEVGTGTA